MTHGKDYPKRPEKYSSLLTSAKLTGVNLLENIEDLGAYGQVVDSVFGFSFNPEGGIRFDNLNRIFSCKFRAPFDTLIDNLSKTETPILSVDVPSGWHVENGPLLPNSEFSALFIKKLVVLGISPSINLSLSAPKPCLKFFKGENYLGGRFLPG